MTRKQIVYALRLVDDVHRCVGNTRLGGMTIVHCDPHDVTKAMSKRLLIKARNLRDDVRLAVGRAKAEA